jgi:hypothetical protein
VSGHAITIVEIRMSYAILMGEAQRTRSITGLILKRERKEVREWRH